MSVKVQEIYDLRECTGFISGTDLHDFFIELINDPSPSGNGEVSEAEILACNGGDEVLALLNTPVRTILSDIREYVIE